MGDKQEFSRPTTGGSRPSGSVRSTTGLTGCEQGWDTSRTPGWSVVHLLWVTKALQTASEEEERSRFALNKLLVHNLKLKYLTQVDFDELTHKYYASNIDVEQFTNFGAYLKKYINRPRSTGIFPFVSILVRHVQNAPETIGRIISLSPKQVYSAVTQKDMVETKRLLMQWFELLIKIQEMRSLAAWHLEGIIKRQVVAVDKKIQEAKSRRQNANEAMDTWKKAMKDSGEVNKFINDLNDIQDMNNDINAVINIFKNPLKAWKSMVHSKIESTLSGSKGKWDVIKAGIAAIGENMAMMELFSAHKTNIQAVLKDFIRVTEDTFTHLNHIHDLELQLKELSLINEMNPALVGVDEFGKF